LSGRSRTTLFYAVVAIILIFLALAQRYLSRLPFAEPEVHALIPFQEKQFGIFVDMSKLLITLATLALGGIGAFVFKRYEGKSLRSAQVFRAITAWLLCVLSLYCGVLINERLVWMFQSGFFNLTNSRILWVYETQFWTLAVAILFLADFFYHGLNEQTSAPTGGTP
jgi:hypothetical protein